MWRFANPATFYDLAAKASPWAAAAGLTLIALGAYMGLFVAPPDYYQGEIMRIMYVHVPAAWMAMFCYGVMALSSGGGLIWNHPLAFVAAKATAPIGMVFTAIALITGSIWGKPTWGTWWSWDARMTSVLILLFLYLGYIALWNAIDEPVRAARTTAILALAGAVNLPVIKFSVNWWNTLHQPASLTRLDGPAIHSSMLIPLLLMALGFTMFYIWLLLLRMRGEILARRVRGLRLARVQAGQG
ncbi:MAG TPA: heme ABC transporter permease [Alphaproteobacteria bacterium]|nr:heme ABC transporter permease [Alphaproteobacteria bacterium]